MFRKKTFLIFLLTVSLISFFAACSDDGNKSNNNKRSLEELYEFDFNYLVLNYFFYYQEKLKSYNRYKNMPIEDMYGSVNNYFKGSGFTRYFSPELAEYILGQLTGDETKPSVFLDTLEGVPFIIITGFMEKTSTSGGTYQEFKNVLQEIKGAKVAIIDLRNNPGGDAEHCKNMSAELSPLNKKMYYSIGRNMDKNGNIFWDTADYFGKGGAGIETKWIFLTSKNTASASEIFISAVKSTRPDDVAVIGETTYGKAIGQYYFVSPYLGGISGVTAMRFFYPNGETYNEIGIAPDIFANSNLDFEIYEAALDAAHDFGLDVSGRNLRQAKNLPSRNNYPIRKTDFGVYKIIDYPKVSQTAPEL